MASPARLPFTVLLCVVAFVIALFALALWEISARLGRFPLGAYLTGCAAVSAAGVGIFAFPHPLHNVFGLSELIGYQAPWVLALTWRRLPQTRRLVAFSWSMAAIVWCAIIANLATLDRHGPLWRLEEPIYGIIQRLQCVAWFVWLAGTSLLLRCNSCISGNRGVRIPMPSGSSGRRR